MAIRLGRNVYVVHGRDCAFVGPVVAYLEAIGLHPILLVDASRSDRSLVERFENFASPAYAVVLLAIETDGDQRAEAEPAKGRPRPDPQLIFQLGYLIGKLGRRFVSALHREDLELPAELSSVLTIPMDDIGIWKFGLLRDLVAAGFPVEAQPPEGSRPTPARGVSVAAEAPRSVKLAVAGLRRDESA